MSFYGLARSFPTSENIAKIEGVRLGVVNGDSASLEVKTGSLMSRAALLLCALLFAGFARAETTTIVFMVPTNESMPLAGYENGHLAAGLYKDLGEAVAGRLGLRADYVMAPAARLSEGMAAGHADALCYVQPAWLDGAFDWSVPLLDDSELIIAEAEAPHVKRIADLADQPLGTVIKYHYPELQSQLGAHFVRDDSQDLGMSIRRVAAGRLKYAVAEKLLYDYLSRGAPDPRIRVDLAYAPITRMCAFSRRSKLSFLRFDGAIKGLIADGTMGRILDSYR